MERADSERRVPLEARELAIAQAHFSNVARENILDGYFRELCTRESRKSIVKFDGCSQFIYFFIYNFFFLAARKSSLFSRGTNQEVIKMLGTESRYVNKTELKR